METQNRPSNQRARTDDALVTALVNVVRALEGARARKPTLVSRRADHVETGRKAA